MSIVLGMCITIVKSLFSNCRHYKSKNVVMDNSENSLLISTAEPAISSYMEYDEYEKDFKIISRSAKPGSYEKETQWLIMACI